MKKIKLEFAPGCFDDFDGTQEELDELIAMIQAKVDDGSIIEDAQPLDIDDLTEEQFQALQAIASKDDRKIQ
jgi:hypothetical protein